MGLIERSLSPYAAPMRVLPHKAPPGTSLMETKRLVIDCCELNKQLANVQTAQAKSKGSIVLIETAKIDHIWAKLKGAKYFSSLNIRSGYHHNSIHPESRPKTAFICPYGKFQWKRVNYGIAHALSVFLSAMFKLFFDYLDDFMIFYVDDVIVCRKTEQDHIANFQKIFEKFHYAGLKCNPSKCDFFKLHTEYLGHLVSSTGIYSLKQKVLAILDLALHPM